LKQLRDQGSSWSEIAKNFPNRTEGSVKKHWYKARPPPFPSQHLCISQVVCAFCRSPRSSFDWKRQTSLTWG
jgi:hypothetical protein